MEGSSRHQELHFITIVTLLLTVGSLCSGHNCTQGGIFPPLEVNGRCGGSSIRTLDGQCCTCPENYYTVHRMCRPDSSVSACSTVVCRRCTNCTNHHKQYKQPCGLNKDSVCGDCMAGYLEPERKKPRSCLKCKPGIFQCAGIVVVHRVVCDKDEGFFPAHWDGQCPAGTIFNKDIGCCQTCQNCGTMPLQWGVGYEDKRVVCDRDLNQFDKHWDGQCPTGTLWNPDSLCCERYNPYSPQPYTPIQKPKQENPQADKPKIEHVCKSALNDFLPFENGQCPSGTVFDADSRCCHGCPDCAPGWKRAPDCVGGCVPCPKRFFSVDTKNNLQCFPCSNCSSLNRKQSFQCVPVKDTQCGNCLSGYVDSPDKPNAICLKDHPSMKPTITHTTTAWVPPPRTSCDQSRGELLPHWDGTCLPGTKLCKQTNCCVPVQKCGAGYRHKFQEDCVPLCEPCPVGTFSSDLEDNQDCTACMQCDLLHRVPQSQCSPTRNTVCGDCLSGYFQQPSANPATPCVKCTDGTCHCNEGKCRELKKDNKTNIAQADESEVKGQQSSVNMVLVGVIGALSGGIITAVGVTAVVCIIRHKKGHSEYIPSPSSDPTDPSIDPFLPKKQSEISVDQQVTVPTTAKSNTNTA